MFFTIYFLGFPSVVDRRHGALDLQRVRPEAVLRVRRRPVPRRLAAKHAGRLGQQVRRKQHDPRPVQGPRKGPGVQCGQGPGGQDQERVSAGQAAVLVLERRADQQFSVPTAAGAPGADTAAHRAAETFAGRRPGERRSSATTAVASQ